MLIIDLKKENRDTVFVAMEKSQEGHWLIQVKNKYKKQVDLHSKYLPMQLVKHAERQFH